MNPASNRPSLRKRLRFALWPAIVLGMMSSMYAYAEWAVSDKTTHEQLDKHTDILGKSRDGSITSSLKRLREVGDGDFSKSDDGQQRHPDAPLKWSENEQDKPSSVDVSVEQRCPKITLPAPPTVLGKSVPAQVTSGENLADRIYGLCKETVETEKAQFKYNLMMSELANKRYARYWSVAEERNQLGADEAGKLQSVTNKLLALQTLIQIDAAQQKAYNDVYNARIHYLKGAQDAIAQNMLSGHGGNGGPSGKGRVRAPRTADAAALAFVTSAFESDALRAERVKPVQGTD